jgi:hypothetical protein
MHPTDKAARVAGALYLPESRRPPAMIASVET